MQDALKPTYVPRHQFLPFHARSQRWTVLVVHRRGGKTVASINELIERGLYTKKANAQFAYCAPQLKQAKRIAWEYLKRYSKHASKRVNEAELYVELINGSKIFVVGADDPDSARGLYFDGVIIDETALIKRSFWYEVLRPALSDRKGWAVFLGTPAGKGNLLYEQRQKAISNPDKWFYLELKASETGLIGPQELAELKDELDEAEYNQEFECSFEAALKGSYYGSYISNLEKRKRLVNTELYDHKHKVSIAIDIGYSDALAVWFWQISKGELRFIDYFETTGMDADDFVAYLNKQIYTYDIVWLPHDAFHKTFQTKKSVFDTFLAANFHPRRVPDPDEGNRVFHGTQAVRKVLKTFPVLFNGRRCREGIEALKNYSREWNVKLGQFNDKPKHDRYSHGADAFRYACQSIQMEDIQRTIEQDDQALLSFAYPTTGLINTGITLNDAIKEYEQQLARERQQGRQRI